MSPGHHGELVARMLALAAGSWRLAAGGWRLAAGELEQSAVTDDDLRGAGLSSS